MYEERFYRNSISSKFRLDISFKESDLLISSDKEIDKDLAKNILIKYYNQIEKYAEINPQFVKSLSPIAQDLEAPPIVRKMIESSHLTGIGPFSSVAGAVALYVGEELLKLADEVIIENGGDLFLKINEDKRIGVYLGERTELKSLTIKIKKQDYPFGIASSSAYLGHSLNLGRADLVTVIAKDSIIADGFATSLSNPIKKEENIEKVLGFAKESDSIEGLLVAFEGKIFLWGALEIES